MNCSFLFFSNFFFLFLFSFFFVFCFPFLMFFQPEKFENVALSDLYDFDFVALSNYDVQYDLWEAEVDQLKDR